MSLNHTNRPAWLTFDCYGTLIQWDEGLLAAVREILRTKQGTEVEPAKLLEVYDRHEHALEQTAPHRSFRQVAGDGLRLALEELGLHSDEGDAEVLTSRISAMPPFPEVVDTLRQLKGLGYRLCIVSNTDDDIIAGNVAQLGGHIDRIVTAQQARAYKPSPQIFAHAWQTLGVDKDHIVHICASPHLDLAAARDIGFRCLWIDRRTGRKPPADYAPDRTFPTLDRAPAFFQSLGWGP